MSEKGTYSDPRCYACKPRIDITLEDKRVNAMLDAATIDAARAMGEMLEVGPRPYHSGRLDVLRKGRAE